jgi:regulatory protein
MEAETRPDSSRPPRRERKPRPLDAERLDELALAYVARFATSQGKLAAYLKRKLRERGWAGEGEPDLAGLVERLARIGYLDDAAYAKMRGASLLRRGLGARRIMADLNAAGLDEAAREGARPSDGAARAALLALAKKRRLGPFATTLPDRAVRERHIATLLRAGHRLDSARELVNLPSPELAEQWAERE